MEGATITIKSDEGSCTIFAPEGVTVDGLTMDSVNDRPFVFTARERVGLRPIVPCRYDHTVLFEHCFVDTKLEKDT